jgi:hypothetical protein
MSMSLLVAWMPMFKVSSMHSRRRLREFHRCIFPSTHVHDDGDLPRKPFQSDDRETESL